ncbi:MAG: hypothetical protein ACLGIN_18150 [Candidatus Sericytochromatia bacterium]
MRQNKINPNHTKTRLYSEVEKALKAGVREAVVSLQVAEGKRKKLVVMHVMGDRVLFFDPELNPELSYALDLGVAGTPVVGGLDASHRYEGNGLHSLTKDFVKECFYDGKAFALIPREAKLLVS